MKKLDEILGAIYRKDLAALATFSPKDANASDEDGRTALMHAVLADDADVAIVRLLIDRGADVRAEDRNQKWTALHFAARDQNAAIVRCLLENGAAVDPLDVFGNTPLWRGVMNATSSLDAIKELFAHGADPEKKNRHGSAPIDVARQTGRDDILAVFSA
jgi:ankyrin repeat protein